MSQVWNIKANAGNVTQNIDPPLKQGTLIRIQTHTCHQSCIKLLEIHVRHTQNKVEDKGTALARSVVVIYHFIIFTTKKCIA